MNDAIHKWFPFTQAEASPNFRCPEWAKVLLYQYYSLKDVK